MLCPSVCQIFSQYLTPDCSTLNLSERPVMEWVTCRQNFDIILKVSIERYWPKRLNSYLLCQTLWLNGRIQIPGLSAWQPFHYSQTSIFSWYLTKLLGLSSELWAKMSSETRGPFQFPLIPSACRLPAVASIVGCKQPLLHKLTAFLSHLLTARVQNSLPALICVNNFKNIIDTK